jgi:NADH-quinone oxidoreductase subunit E
MSVRRLATEQPEAFAFSPENLRWAKEQLKKYPEGRQASAVIPLLWRAQEQCGGWLPEPALRYVADMLGLAYIRIYEIATFYTMFNLAPVGRYYVQVCGTTPCWLRGADEIKSVCRKRIGEPSHVTEDGLFSWTEVECLGACVNAPMVQINKDYYEDLTPASFERILADLREGREVKSGPQDGRRSSEPFSGRKTLLSAEPT